MYHFYTEVRKKKTNENDQTDGNYKTQTLKCIRAALGQYFKDTCSIDIIRNELFLQANESYPPIEDPNLKKLTEYSKKKSMDPNMQRSYNRPLCSISYTICVVGAVKIFHKMTKNTFAIPVNPSNNKEYICQKIDEADKNNGHKDTIKANQG